uniref:Uncharacterized protein n=1 Tax=viral metagenome TaxID=1070528 RepID=A0A6M3IUD9_9ZZZZ
MNQDLHKLTIGIIRRSKEIDKELALQELGRIIQRFAFEVGAQSDPQLNLTICWDIFNHYKDLTFTNIQTAFGLYRVSKLHYLKEEHYNHYGRFNTLFVCRVLNAYREKKRIDYMNRPEVIPKPAKALPVSPEAQEKTIREIIENSFERYRTENSFILFNVDSVFDYLTKLKMIDDWDNIKGIYVKRVKEPNKNDNKEKTIADLMDTIFNIYLDADETEIRTAKKLYLQDRFLYWIKEGKLTVFDRKD